MKHTAFGEIRSDTGTNPTDYHEPKQSFGFKVKAVPAFTHTQEQRYEVEFGLSYYVARWYDADLGHFISADTIIPQPGNALDWDRYAYVLWNPMRYTDPSGHTPCNEDGFCPNNIDSEDEFIEAWSKYYGIKMTGNWSTKDKWEMLFGVQTVGTALADVIRYAAAGVVFKSIFGSLEFQYSSGNRDGSWSCLSGSGGIVCDPDSNGQITSRLVGHELGHIFNNKIKSNGQITPYYDLSQVSIFNNENRTITGLMNGNWQRGYEGYKSQGIPDIYHGPDDWPNDPHTNSVNEEYADMFLNWAFNSFDNDLLGAGMARYDWMQANMAEWVQRSR